MALALIHSPTWASIPGRPGSWSARRTKQDSPRFRDERIWRQVVWERTNVCVGCGAGVVGRGTEETEETERARERRSWSRRIRWRREGWKGGSLPTYPKFQPVPPVSPRYRFLFRHAGPPLAGPPRHWRGVSCGRPASLLLRRESSFIPRSTHCIRVLAFFCSSCSFVREIDVLLTPFSFTWSFSRAVSLSLSVFSAVCGNNYYLGFIPCSYMCVNQKLSALPVFRSFTEQSAILL